jgi:hypothetical protein
MARILSVRSILALIVHADHVETLYPEAVLPSSTKLSEGY